MLLQPRVSAVHAISASRSLSLALETGVIVLHSSSVSGNPHRHLLRLSRRMRIIAFKQARAVGIMVATAMTAMAIPVVLVLFDSTPSQQLFAAGRWIECSWMRRLQ